MFNIKKIKSFRISSPLPYISLVEETLEKQGIQIKDLSFYSKARVCINKKIPLGSSIANFFGHICIQDLSSMLPPLLLNPKPGSTVLDLCASPGGKTGILSELVGNKGIIIANEPNPKRYVTLQKNIERLNLLNVAITSYKGQEFPNFFKFKYVLADVPCSGWGTVEKNPNVMKLWTGKNIKPLIKLQRQIIKRAFEILDIGGKLIYSTCTTNKQENQAQIEWALANFPFELIPLKKIDSFFYEENGQYSKEILNIKGHKLCAQGFFVACLKKIKGPNDDTPQESKTNMESIEGNFIKENLHKIGLDATQLSNGIFYLKKNKIYFVPKFYNWNKVKVQGISIGQLKGKSFFPNPRLWCLFKKNEDNIIQLKDIKAIERLISGNSMTISCNNKFIKLYYKDLPLCLLSVKGNRCLLSK